MEYRYFKLKIDLPFLKKGSVFAFNEDSAIVYSVDNKEVAEYPLRTGLASYLCLLRSEGSKYLKEVKLTPQN